VGRRSGEGPEASGCHRVTEFAEVLIRLRACIPKPRDKP
jgi:hypothetical protein